MRKAFCFCSFLLDGVGTAEIRRRAEGKTASCPDGREKQRNSDGCRRRGGGQRVSRPQPVRAESGGKTEGEGQKEQEIHGEERGGQDFPSRCLQRRASNQWHGHKQQRGGGNAHSSCAVSDKACVRSENPHQKPRYAFAYDESRRGTRERNQQKSRAAVRARPPFPAP